MSTEKPSPTAEHLTIAVDPIFPEMPRAHDRLRAVEAKALWGRAGRQ